MKKDEKLEVEFKNMPGDGVDKKPELNIKGLKIEFCNFNIVGTAPLIVHRFSEKAIRMIEDKQKKKSKDRSERDPQAEMDSCLYKFVDGKRTGFPANGFKAAMIRAGKSLEYVMKDLQSQFFVVGTDGGDLVEIKGEYALRTDMVRVGQGVADIRYRPEYKEWTAELIIKYNSAVISNEQLGQLVIAAGFGCGIGEMRPEKSKSGSYGVWMLVE